MSYPSSISPTNKSQPTVPLINQKDVIKVITRSTGCGVKSILLKSGIIRFKIPNIAAETNHPEKYILVGKCIFDPLC